MFFWLHTSPFATGLPRYFDGEGGGSEGDTPTGAGNQGTGQTFTQDEVNRIVGEKSQRLKDAHERSLSEAIAKERTAAVEDFKKQQSKESKKQQAQVDSDLTAHQAEAAKWRKKAEEYKAESEQHLAARVRAGVDDVVIKTASKMKFIDPNDTLLHVRGRVKFDHVKGVAYVVDNEGKPSGETVEELLTTLATEKDYLVQPTGTNGSGSHIPTPGANNDQAEDRTSATHIRAHLAAARKQMGRE
jgi:hypothetical protein